MATTALDEIDIGGHGDALTVETKQAEAPAKPASKVPLTIATKPPTVADQVARRAALPRAVEDRAATSRTGLERLGEDAPRRPSRDEDGPIGTGPTSGRYRS